MNGEIVQICDIVMSAKKAFIDNKNINFMKSRYVDQIQFICLPKKSLFQKKKNKVYSVSEWFQICKERKLIDIKLFIPIKVKNKNILGFANTSQSSIVCFFEKGKVTYFTAKWEFKKGKKLCDVTYQEYCWENHPQSIPRFENNIDSFQNTLLEIEKLAYSIKADDFAKRFHKAYECLCGLIDEDDYQENVPQLPNQFKKFTLL